MAALGAVEGRNLDTRGLKPDMGVPAALLLGERLAEPPDADHGRCLPAKGSLYKSDSSPVPFCRAEALPPAPSLLSLPGLPSDAVARSWPKGLSRMSILVLDARAAL